ncbi:MAG TPA: hypothetical protein VN636_10280, partial [Acidimicrobiia bacterium]|nr:hypothetical protein [Acidimicrobiia bacterium]
MHPSRARAGRHRRGSPATAASTRGATFHHPVFARRRRKRGAVIAVVLSLAFIAGVGFVTVRSLAQQAAAKPTCRVASSSGSYLLDVEQAANASTIAAVGKRAGLPDHAVTIALAAAIQESQLHNLPYGDRDSLGLFQQRPSQGWGTRSQLLTPRFAAAAFFGALARVPNWNAIAVADAAQAVQHSNAPEAYGNWESEARTLAIALTGEKPAGFGCRLGVDRAAHAAGPLQAAMAAELGVVKLGDPLPAARGWTVATWLVAH